MLFRSVLFLTLGQIRIGPSRSYTALTTDASGLASGDVVKVAGVRVGQVDSVDISRGNGEGNGEGNVVAVRFHVDSAQQITSATRLFVRYENLLGDRYLELQQDPGEGTPLASGAEIPADRVTPALSLDVLLNGFRPQIGRAHV